MTRLRARLTSAVMTWLVCQALAIVSTPVALARGAACPVAADGTCPDSMAGTTCPMHHSAAQSRTCRMTNACAPQLDGVLIAIGPVGLVPEVVPTPVPDAEPASSASVSSSPLFRSIAPDLPPPRA